MEEMEEEKEVITLLGLEKRVQKPDRTPPRGRVITWLGEKPEGIDEAYDEAEAERKRRREEKDQKKRSVSYPPIEQLPFELIPKSVRMLRPERVTDPVDLPDALRHEESSKEHDDTVRIDIRLSIDPRKSNQFVRGLTVLPHGTGRAPRIAVFAEGRHAQVAREAEADIVGGAELIQEVLDSQGAVMEKIDKCIATPAMMAAGMAKLGKILGPRGLMPNPRVGTLTENIEEAIQKLRQGQVEFRIDRYGILRSPLGKVSFGLDKLMENTITYGNDVIQARPALFQQKPVTDFLHKITLSSTMGRGFPVSIPSYATLLSEGVS